MRNVCCNVLSANDDVSRTGGKVDSNQLVSASFHAYFGDSSAAGTISIQASNDPCPTGYIPGAFAPTNWIDIPNATATITAGAPALISIPQMCYRWVRVVFTQSSAGNTTVNVNMDALSI